MIMLIKKILRLLGSAGSTIRSGIHHGNFVIVRHPCRLQVIVGQCMSRTNRGNDEEVSFKLNIRYKTHPISVSFDEMFHKPTTVEGREWSCIDCL